MSHGDNSKLKSSNYKLFYSLAGAGPRSIFFTDVLKPVFFTDVRLFFGMAILGWYGLLVWYFFCNFVSIMTGFEWFPTYTNFWSRWYFVHTIYTNFWSRWCISTQNKYCTIMCILSPRFCHVPCTHGARKHKMEKKQAKITRKKTIKEIPMISEI